VIKIINTMGTFIFSIRNISAFLILSFVLFTFTGSKQSYGQSSENIAIKILWHDCLPEGTVTVRYGKLDKIEIRQGKGTTDGNKFTVTSGEEAALVLVISGYSMKQGSESTLITLNVYEHHDTLYYDDSGNPTIISTLTGCPFSFFLRDVSYNFPVFIPGYHAAVLLAPDPRTFGDIAGEIAGRHLKTKLDMQEDEPEESFESAALVTRDQSCPTWLGLGRDARTFSMNYSLTDAPGEYEVITPRLVSDAIKLKELGGRAAEYAFVTGRGQGPVVSTVRRLEEGILPILHTTMTDEDITYQSVCFVTLERSPLTALNNKGTHYLVADNYAFGHMFTDTQLKVLAEKQKEDSLKKEETVLWYHSIAVNNSPVPRYAWFKAPKPGRGWWSGYAWYFEPETGFSFYENGNVFSISRLNSRPLPDEEIAVLLQPGDSAVFEFCLPHSPITRLRAASLSKQSFDNRYQECRQYWRQKLAAAPVIRLPEKRIEEMMYAGLLHLDLVAYGNEPGGTLAPTIGVYSPIGTESAPIIQYFNSMGWHDIARRSLMYFIEKQHEDGMIQNFGGYMVETGAALWTMGEYFRYTHDLEWLKAVTPALIISGNFLLRWRQANMSEALKGKGYGMISGKVADPQDDYHQYMLNAYAYLGLKRVAEMLEHTDPDVANHLAGEAESWRNDIRGSLYQSMASAPVIPAGDGTWCPTVPPWTESTGPQALFVDPVNCYSHGTFTTRDVLLGPLYLVFCEVLDPDEEIAAMMLKYHSELFYQRNSAFSQPYYSRHAWILLKNGKVKPFLKTYYTTVSALADRETYTFWEHLYHASPHKTHEEAWFLMETRWMLYMEEGNTLNLMPGIPRRWLENGKEIVLGNAASYFGNLSVHIASELEKGVIKADIHCDPERKPGTVVLRIPHPEYRKAVKVTGGTYDAQTETVIIDAFTGEASVVLTYQE
jgi:hypothetical protein